MIRRAAPALRACVADYSGSGPAIIVQRTIPVMDVPLRLNEVGVPPTYEA